MKLVELLGVKKYHDSTMKQVILDLTRSGELTHHKGSAARVLVGPNFVYKFWVADTAYDMFIEYALKHQSNPMMPRFLSRVRSLTAFFKRPIKFPDEIKFVKMEKLEQISDDHRIFDGYNVKLEDFIAEIAMNPKLSLDGVMQTFSDLQEIELEPNQRREAEEIYSTVHELLKLYDGVNLENWESSGTLDLHDENVMLRGSQLVFTDPGITDEDLNFNNFLIDYLHRVEMGYDPGVKGPKRSNRS
jgi:hypothetical protein